MEEYSEKLVNAIIEKKRKIGKPLSEVRCRKLGYNTNTLERMAKKPLKQVLSSVKETLKLKEIIDASDYQAWTKSDYRLMLRMLWKEANGYAPDDSAPKEIRFLRVGIDRKDKKHPKTISEEEIKLMLACTSGRNRAMIHLLYEAGLRPHELLRLRKTDVEFTKDGARIHVPPNTKTGARDVLVIDCVPNIAGYVANHPLRGSNALLFPALRGEGKSNMMCVEALNKIVKAAAKEAGITRNIKTYVLRHTAATRLASILTDAQMKAYFGWSQASDMAGVYIHMSGRDTDGPLLAAHGKMVDKNELEGKLEPKICKRCGKQNAHDAQMCQYCGLSTDKDKAKSDMLSMQQEMVKLKKRLDKFEEEKAEETAKQSKE